MTGPPTTTAEGRGDDRSSSGDSLVAFLFGVAGVPELPGVALTQLLVDLGMSVAAARRQITRMRAEGRLASSRSGRGAAYRLAGSFGATFARLRSDRGGPPALPEWTGAFHGLLFQVPETQRSFRNRLRARALHVGYGMAQPGVLIAVQDRRAEIAEVVAEAPAGALVHHVRIAMELPDAAAVVARAWDLPALSADLCARLGELEDALADPVDPPPDVGTLRRLARLVAGTSAALVRDPLLPAQLCPPDWPSHRVRITLDAVKDRYVPPAGRYVRTLGVR